MDDWSCLDDSSDECWSEDADDYTSSLNGRIKGVVAGQTLSESEDQKPGKGKYTDFTSAFTKHDLHIPLYMLLF